MRSLESEQNGRQKRKRYVEKHRKARDYWVTRFNSQDKRVERKRLVWAATESLTRAPCDECDLRKWAKRVGGTPRTHAFTGERNSIEMCKRPQSHSFDKQVAKHLNWATESCLTTVTIYRDSCPQLFMSYT